MSQTSNRNFVRSISNTTHYKLLSAGSCPSSHKYAYLDGKYCCQTNQEKIDSSGGDGELCDGSEISIDSTCCEDNEYAKCSFESCTNYEVGSCPSSHKYAYLDGKYCCRTNREKTSENDGELCDGSEIGIDSACCEDNDYAKCEFDGCTNFEDANQDEIDDEVSEEDLVNCGKCWEADSSGNCVPQQGKVVTICGSNSIQITIDACVLGEDYDYTG